MRLKKRTLWLLVPIGLLGVFIVSRMEFLKFRQSEKKQTEYLLKRGQEVPTFHTYEVDTGKKKPQKIHYTHVGDRSKPLVVLVHGSPGSSSAMLGYLADTTLTSFAQVIAVDRPGYGYSDFGKTERSLKKQALALKPILEQYKNVPIILAGHSFGGPVIARMAMDFPTQVDGLVIVAGSIDPALEPQQWWTKVIDWWGIRWLLPPSFRVANQEILPLRDDLETIMPMWEKITCPVTIIQGEQDKLVPMGNAYFGEKMLTNSSNLDIRMVEGGDHFIWWSMRLEVVQAIRELAVP